MTQQDNFWLTIADELRSIAQCGKTYCQNPFDLERYEQLLDISVRILDRNIQEPEKQIKDLFAQEIGYLTPKLDMRAGVFKDNKVLLVQESADNCWSLPGGWADVNESPSEGIVREVFEETGYEVKTLKLTYLLDKLKHEHPPQLPHAYKAFFLCELVGGEAKISHESIAVDWFSLDKLPPLSQHRVVESQIQNLFKHHQDQSLATEYD